MGQLLEKEDVSGVTAGVGVDDLVELGAGGPDHVDQELGDRHLRFHTRSNSLNNSKKASISKAQPSKVTKENKRT